MSKKPSTFPFLQPKGSSETVVNVQMQGPDTVEPYVSVSPTNRTLAKEPAPTSEAGLRPNVLPFGREVGPLPEPQWEASRDEWEHLPGTFSFAEPYCLPKMFALQGPTSDQQDHSLYYLGATKVAEVLEGFGSQMVDLVYATKDANLIFPINTAERQRSASWRANDLLVALSHETDAGILRVQALKEKGGHTQSAGGSAVPELLSIKEVRGGTETKLIETRQIKSNSYYRSYPVNRMGMLAFDQRGRLYCSTVASDDAPASIRQSGGAIYMIEPKGKKLLAHKVLVIGEKQADWGGAFGFDNNGTLYLSSGEARPKSGEIYQTDYTSPPTIPTSSRLLNVVGTLWHDIEGGIHAFRFIGQGALMYRSLRSRPLIADNGLAQLQVVFPPALSTKPADRPELSLSLDTIARVGGPLIGFDVIPPSQQEQHIEFSIEDVINRTWRQEYVDVCLFGRLYDSGIVERFCDPSWSPRLTKLDGNKVETIPSQRKDLGVAFVSEELLALSENQYKLSFVPVERVLSPNVAWVSPDEKSVTFATKWIEVTFPLGTYKANIPGPVTSIKCKMTQKAEVSFGGSELYGPKRPKSMKAELVDNGAVFARVVFTYEYDTYIFYLSAALAAGDAQVFWTQYVESKGEQEDAKEKESGWRLELSRGLSVLDLLYHSEEGLNLEVGDLQEISRRQTLLKGWLPLLKDKLPTKRPGWTLERIMELRPWNEWFDGRTQSIWTFRTLMPGAQGKEAFFQMQATAPEEWLAPVSLDNLSYKNLSAKNDEFAAQNIPLVGVLEQGGKQFKSIYAEWNQVRGFKSWSFGLYAPPIDYLRHIGRPDKGAPKDAAIGLGHLLNKVRRWDLRPSLGVFDPTQESTFLMYDRESLRANRRKEKVPPVDFGPAKQILDAVDQTTLLEYQKLQSAAKGALIVLTYDAEKARTLLDILEALLQRAVNFERRQTAPLSWEGAKDKESQDYFSFLPNGDTLLLFYVYALALELEVIPKDKQELIATQITYISHKVHEAACWSVPRAYSTGNNNMIMNYVMIHVYSALLCRENPNHESWLSDGVSVLFSSVLLEGLGPNGETAETSHYSAFTLENYGLLARSLETLPRVRKRLLLHPKLFAMIKYMLRHYTVEDPRTRTLLPQDKRGFLTSKSDRTGSYNEPNKPSTPFDKNRIGEPNRSLHSYQRSYMGARFVWPALFAVLMAEVATEDPSRREAYQELSKGLVAIWKQSGKSTKHGTLYQTGIEGGLAIECEDLPDESLPLRSHSNANFTVFNHGYGSTQAHQMFFLNTQLGFGRQGSGSIKGIYAFGKPISSNATTGVVNRSGIFFKDKIPTQLRISPLQSRVLASRPWMDETGGEDVFVSDDIQTMSRSNRHFRFFSDLNWQDYVYFDSAIKGATTAKKSDSGYFAYPREMGGNWPKTAAFAEQDGVSIATRKQILFVKDNIRNNQSIEARPEGIHYYVFRDEVNGFGENILISKPQPTEWTMWTLTQGFGSSYDEIALKENKRKVSEEAVPLGRGKRFTAIGQYCADSSPKNPFPYDCKGERIDIEYYVALPESTTRSTMRWGWKTEYLKKMGVYAGMDFQHNELDHFQDLLHLQMGGDGIYFVVLFPRKHDTGVEDPLRQKHSAPSFETFAGKKVILISGVWKHDASKSISYEDYIYMSGTPAGVPSQGGDKLEVTTLNHNNTAMAFTGRAASVLNRGQSVVLNIAEGDIKNDRARRANVQFGEVKYGAYMLRSEWELPEPKFHPQNSDTTLYSGAVSMYIDEEALIIETPSDFPGGLQVSITFQLPAASLPDFGSLSGVARLGGNQYQLLLQQDGHRVLFFPLLKQP